MAVDMSEVVLAVNGIREDARPLLAQETARTLRGPRSAWPVDSGLSKASFRAEGNRVVNDTEYALFVEHSPHVPVRRPARTTVQNEQQTIADAVSRRLNR